MARRGLTFVERSEISTASKAGCGVRQTAFHLAGCPSIISRELRRNSTRTRDYQAVPADVKTQHQRACPQARKVTAVSMLEARVNADLEA